MTDRVAVVFSDNRANEGSQIIATAHVRSGSDEAVPTTLEWKLYNETRKELLVDWTSLTAAASASITVLARYNRCDEPNRTERIALMVAADRGLSTQIIGKGKYTLVNLLSYNSNDHDALFYLLDVSGRHIFDASFNKIEIMG